MPAPFNSTTTADELAQHFSAEIKDKIILTTGPSPTSIGATFVESIARAQPALIILAGRNTSKLQKTADAIARENANVPVRLLQLDLGSLAAVREAAKQVNSWEDVPRIDVLVNNAGIMATEFALSPEGFENQFATNHLGHFLFTNLIMNKILAAPSSRVVNVSSDGHRLGPIRWGDYNFQNGETYNRWSAYGQSKTANILMAVSLAERLGPKGLQAYSLHPGVIFDTSLSLTSVADALDKSLGNPEGWGAFKKKTNQQGAATTVYAAFEPGLQDRNGAYLQDCHVADPWTETVKPWATDKVEAERLWKLSEELVKQDRDDTPHFQSIPWVADLLRDNNYITTPTIPSRTVKPSMEDSFFATTINTPSTISAFLMQYRRPSPSPPTKKEGKEEKEETRTTETRLFCTLGPALNGYPGVLHGGVAASLLDEAMGLILSLSLGYGRPGTKGPVTAYLNTRFVRPVQTPGTVVVSARIVESVQGRKWKIVGEIRDSEGAVRSWESGERALFGACRRLQAINGWENWKTML
ncbi:hypothetical protein BJX61DRAFT_535956 [Aspergillus egyptiacus]|nr:hypothetical protein BJX61DRAFT_535956 [Aspergillus egyptiacus]